MRRTHLRRPLIVALLLLPVTARADDDAVFRDVLGCIRGAVGTAGEAIDLGMVPKLFTHQCPAACPGLAAWPGMAPDGGSWKALASGCGLFCSHAARAAFESATPSRRWLQLATTCGPERYGLPAAQASLLSEVWFIAHTIGEWLARTNREAGPKSRRALDDLAKTLPRVHWGLPFPPSLPRWYEELPPGSVAFTDVGGPSYVLIRARGDVSIGAIPEARLTLEGARLVTDWPGKVTPLPSLSALQAAFHRPVGELASQPPHPADATLARVRANGPVLLADASLPAARLVEVVRALGEDGAHLAVTDGRGAVGEHAIALTARPIAIGASTSHISLLHRAARRRTGPVDAGPVLWLNVQDATVKELVEELNRLNDQGVHLVVFDDEDAGRTPPLLDQENIQGFIHERIGEVRRCYDAELERHRVAGRVKVQFTVVADGSVAEAKVQEPRIGVPALEACLLAKVKSWRFPRPKGGKTVVSYPFVFQPAEP